MKLFTCQRCGQLVYFENNHCESCGLELGFVSERLQLVALEKNDGDQYAIWGEDQSALYRYCINHEYGVCNWLVLKDSAVAFCKACSFNRTIPDLNKIEYRRRWHTIENAKHRLIYSLLKLNLPLVSKSFDVEKGLLFDFLADDNNREQRVLTGHDSGLITLNIAEADDVEREMTRRAMDEVYRTVLGHFRHEIGHYYWDRLIDSTDSLERFRILFGDERKDYALALQEHYSKGVPVHWNNEFISAYATMHPWEDWAETWAHYLHIIDTLETAYSFGISVHPTIAQANAFLNADVAIDPYKAIDFNQVLNLWFPVSFALNSLNRSMGLHDLYPFVIPPKAIEKLSFIHSICKSYSQ